LKMMPGAGNLDAVANQFGEVDGNALAAALFVSGDSRF